MSMSGYLGYRWLWCALMVILVAFSEGFTFKRGYVAGEGEANPLMKEDTRAASAWNVANALSKWKSATNNNDDSATPAVEGVKRNAPPVEEIDVVDFTFWLERAYGAGLPKAYMEGVWNVAYEVWKTQTDLYKTTEVVHDDGEGAPQEPLQKRLETLSELADRGMSLRM